MVFNIIDELNCKKEPEVEIVNVAVICRLSLTPLMGTMVEPFKSNVYLPGETQEIWDWS